MVQEAKTETIPSGWSGVLSAWKMGAERQLSEWRRYRDRKHLQGDLLGGVVVALSSLPLSLAVALATDVPVVMGLVTAVVAGLLGSLFGGTRTGITGPAAVMAVLLGQIVDRSGLAALFVVGICVGVLQLLTGMLGLARLLRVVPISIVRGFTAGVAITLMINQVPGALGLPSADESHSLDVLLHLARTFEHAHFAAVVLMVLALLVTLFLPRIWPALPAPAIALGLALGVNAWGGLGVVSTLGALTDPFALTHVGWPIGEARQLVFDVVAVFAVGSVEALTRATLIDRDLESDAMHDPDQVLIGQGLANLASALLGGFPVTKVVLRSAFHRAAGARTPRGGVLAALLMTGVVVVLWPILPHFPVPALIGVLLALCVRMLSLTYLRDLWVVSRADAVVFMITVAAMVIFDASAGVQIGALIALIVGLVSVSRTRFELMKSPEDGAPHHVTLSGPLTFISTTKLDTLARSLFALPTEAGTLIDLRHVDSVDASAADHLVSLVRKQRDRGMKVALLGANADVDALLRSKSEDLGDIFAKREADLDRILDRVRGTHSRTQLLAGVRRFHTEQRERLAPLLQELAAGQAPHTLMLTCADSRVVPTLLTGTQPGELFVIRNIGALLPPFGHETLNDEGAGIEYAVKVLGVQHIVLCAHSGCGAMKALKMGGLPDELGALKYWAKSARELVPSPDASPNVDEFSKATVVRQLVHLRSYPTVQRAMEAGELTLNAWFYDVEHAAITEWSEEESGFRQLDESMRQQRVSVAPKPIPSAPPSAELGEV
jgi:carbonic anhydrase